MNPSCSWHSGSDAKVVCEQIYPVAIFSKVSDILFYTRFLGLQDSADSAYIIYIASILLLIFPYP